ncbi:MAG: hypothetical protein AB7F86_05125 [Bdellovibrionales bacterium]
MLSRKFLALALVCASVALANCAPKKNKKTSVKRGGRASAGAQANVRPGSIWVAVNAGGDVQLRVEQLANPYLSGLPNEQQIGTVNPTNDIFFIGQIVLGANGAPTAESVFHMEIYDNKTGQTINGNQIWPFYFDLDKAQEGFVAEGNVTRIRLADPNISIAIVGTKQGDQYVGQILFANSATQFQEVSLGNFQTSYCGLFKCN